VRVTCLPERLRLSCGQAQACLVGVLLAEVMEQHGAIGLLRHR
jgi:hypothetical protein